MTESQSRKEPKNSRNKDYKRSPSTFSSGIFGNGNSNYSGLGSGGLSTNGILAKLIFSSIALVVAYAAFQVFTIKRSINIEKTSLKHLELNPTPYSQQAMQVAAPRYGLEDKTVEEEQVYIILRDNGAEDGDHVTLYVNGQAYTSSLFLRNAGNTIKVPLNPGPNLVQIRGDRDGGGGVTLAADVSDQGNQISTPMPEGGTAMFYIIRK